ncbi:uncharacterized protein DS421_2g51910 [Arachis hypogaea]|nr:uncharacterized protein DS421_2g51910 [Arachis hypogaea]
MVSTILIIPTEYLGEYEENPSEIMKWGMKRPLFLFDLKMSWGTFKGQQRSRSHIFDHYM